MNRRRMEPFAPGASAFRERWEEKRSVLDRADPIARKRVIDDVKRVLHGAPATSVRYITKHLVWKFTVTPDEARLFIAEAREQIRNSS